MSRLLGVAAAVTAVALLLGLAVHDPRTEATSASPDRPQQSAALTGGAVPCPEAGQARTLSVLTFNIHGARTETDYDLSAIAEEIRARDVDVVLLQEVDRHQLRSGLDDQPALLARELGMHMAFGRNVVRRPAVADGPRQEYGTAILSRFPIRARRNLHLPNQPGLERRGLLQVTIDLDGQPVHVYTTHLQHTSGAVRVQQIRAIRAVVANDPVPHLLGGDLNATPESRTARITQGFLVDAWSVAGDRLGLTVPERTPRRRIDYVWHDENWRTTSARTFGSRISDHRALRVGLELRPASCA